MIMKNNSTIFFLGPPQHSLMNKSKKKKKSIYLKYEYFVILLISLLPILFNALFIYFWKKYQNLLKEMLAAGPIHWLLQSLLRTVPFIGVLHWARGW